MNEANRRTGRTTRMINYGIKLADAGRAVYLMFHSEAEARVHRSNTDDERLKFETEVSLGNFCWDTMTLRGAHPNCVVLVDHFIFEVRLRGYEKFLHGAHRWDDK